MKKILASAAIFAVLLCGCSDIEEISVPSVNPASSEQEASLPEGGFSEYSYSSSVSKSEITKKRTVPAEKTYVVHNKKQLFIRDGGELTVEGKFDADDTGKITIEKGGALILNGESVLNCEITIEDGGKLVIGENGELSGNGRIIILGEYNSLTNRGIIYNGIEIN